MHGAYPSSEDRSPSRTYEPPPNELRSEGCAITTGPQCNLLTTETADGRELLHAEEREKERRLRKTSSERAGNGSTMKSKRGGRSGDGSGERVQGRGVSGNECSVTIRYVLGRLPSLMLGMSDRSTVIPGVPGLEDFLLQTSVIYHAFSPKEAKQYNVQQWGAKRAEAFVKAFLRRSMPRMSQQACEQHLQRKAIVLEYFTRRKRKEKKKKSKGLSAKERRDLRLFDIKQEQQKYSLFLPLHELWKQYIRDLCNGLKADTQPQMIQAKLLKADLHGAIISVTKSKCPSYVGVTGILLQETKHVFKIITKEDRLKVIPKLNSVFAIEIDGFISYIYGSKFQLRSSERSAKKFKGKGTIDL
ncbi:LOW QUALITY PROTEIN: ribonuclease P protein subunit p29 [Ctenodactylus gundi]